MHVLMKKGEFGPCDVVEYELVNARRYRRFAALVMVRAIRELPGFTGFLSESFRDCDLVCLYDQGGTALILMGETAQTDAEAAIHRVRSATEGLLDLRFALATYPRDGHDAAALMAAADRRLREAVRAIPGAVVETG